jgi:hypothetical protein
MQTQTQLDRYIGRPQRSKLAANADGQTADQSVARRLQLVEEHMNKLQTKADDLDRLMLELTKLL